MLILWRCFCLALFIVAACTTSSDSIPCSDGTITGGEECDDGNTTSGDGCSSVCVIETGFLCDGRPSACAPICGDGKLIADEVCDDGNTTSGDGCSNVCVIEAGWTCASQDGLISCHCGVGYYRALNGCAEEKACLSSSSCGAPGLCVNGTCRAAPAGCEKTDARLGTDGAPCPRALSMLLWLDASESSLVRYNDNQAQVSEQVTAWHDRSGNGNTAVAFKNTEAAPPIDRSPVLKKNAQGQPYLDFNGASFMEVNDVDVRGQDITSIVVAQRVVGGVGSVWAQQHDGAFFRDHILSMKAPANTWAVHSMQARRTVQQTVQGEQIVDIRDEWLTGVPYHTGSPPQLTDTIKTGIGLGALTASGEEGNIFSTIYISEIMLFAGLLSDDERHAIERHLITKWKLKTQGPFTFVDMQPLTYTEDSVISPISHSKDRVPRVVDWDHDGYLDLLVAHDQAIFFYKNIGTSQVPQFSPATPIQANGTNIATNQVLSGIAVVNMGGTTRPDLVVSGRANDQSPSHLYVYLDTATQGAPVFEAPTVIRQRSCDGEDAVCAFTLTSPRFDLADVNGDSYVDLVVGDYSGSVQLFHGDQYNRFDSASVVTLENSCSYNCYPRLFDLNRSSAAPVGMIDYIVGVNWGRIQIVENPTFASGLEISDLLRIVNIQGEARLPAADSHGYLKDTTDGPIPDFADLNGDGMFDLILGGHGNGTSIMVAYGVSTLGCTTDACDVSSKNVGVCVDDMASASPAIMCYCDAAYQTSASGGCEAVE